MGPAVRGFLRSAVVWLAVGLLLGIWMALDPARGGLLRPAHLHALLPGFVLFMIFGVGYHVLPRFAGRPVPWARGPMFHLGLANAGVVFLVGGFLVRASWPAASLVFLPIGGLLVTAGAFLFIHAVWRLTEAPRWSIPMGGAPPQPISTPQPPP